MSALYPNVNEMIGDITRIITCGIGAGENLRSENWLSYGFLQYWSFCPSDLLFQIRQDTIPAEITWRGQWSDGPLPSGNLWHRNATFRDKFIGHYRPSGSGLKLKWRNLYAHYLWEPALPVARSRLYWGWVKWQVPVRMRGLQTISDPH